MWIQGQAAWSSRQRVGLAIWWSRVRVPLWPLAGVVLGYPDFKSSATLVNSQLVVLNPVMLYLNYSFSKYLLIVKRFGSLRERRYISVYYYYYYGSVKLKFWDAIFSKTRTNNTKQQQVVLSSKVQVWLWRGRHCRKKNKRREKHTPKTTLAGKQTLYFDGLRHIVSSQTSTMMEPSTAISEHETTNQR